MQDQPNERHRDGSYVDRPNSPDSDPDELRDALGECVHACGEVERLLRQAGHERLADQVLEYSVAVELMSDLVEIREDDEDDHEDEEGDR